MPLPQHSVVNILLVGSFYFSERKRSIDGWARSCASKITAYMAPEFRYVNVVFAPSAAKLERQTMYAFFDSAD